MEKQALILFTRLPLPGAVKTRLLPHLGDEACASLQWALLADLAPVLRHKQGELFVFYTPSGHPQELRCLQELVGPASYVPQQGQDLGQRMQVALELVFNQGYTHCLLLGSDIPLISSADIVSARELLQRHDVVLAPSVDGGYWLMGLKQPCPALFQQPSYGHGQVLAQAQAVCAVQCLSVGLAARKRDIDTWEDLEYFRQEITPANSPALYAFMQSLGI